MCVCVCECVFICVYVCVRAACMCVRVCVSNLIVRRISFALLFSAGATTGGVANFVMIPARNLRDSADRALLDYAALAWHDATS